MNILKSICNFFGSIAAFFLSIILIAVLLIIPIVSGVTSFSQIDNLKKVVSQINFSEWEVLEKGSDSEMITAVVKTDMLAEIIELYIEDIFLTLEESAEERNLTPEAIKTLANEHMDELIPIAKEMMAKELSLTAGGIAIKDEDIAKMIQQVLDEEAETLIEAFPTVEDLGINDDVVLGLKYLREGVILRVVIGIAAVLSLLILLFRCIKWKGFMWLGVVYLIATGMTIIEAVGISKGASSVTAEVVPESEGLLEPIFTTFAAEMYKVSGTMALFAVAFIVVYALGKKAGSKKASETDMNFI